ncbi:hypothetical protein AGLY_007422 [Aphis glycines]|uniref:Uncharacterized protein n=1 Tax=Aphis glycines TaxID=307491 RepID=A0A6G0TP55_APHGL|nr:hypothetical protein AGLY_007422 [Aphis glycines]
MTTPITMKIKRYLKLVTKPFSTNIYKERLTLLQNIFLEDIGVTDVKLIDVRCNVSYIITSFLKSAPFDVKKQCFNCTMAKTTPSPTIILNSKNSNLYNLERFLTITRILENHLFIETDLIDEHDEYSLADLQYSLTIDNIIYYPELFHMDLIIIAYVHREKWLGSTHWYGEKNKKDL